MDVENMTKVPSWLMDHPELQGEASFSAQTNAVFATSAFEPPVRVVKIVEPGNQEAAIYRRLQRDPCRRNHTMPCEIIECEGQKTILIMPSAHNTETARMSKWTLSGILDVFLQVVEGVEYLHEQNIAHMPVWTAGWLRGGPISLTSERLDFSAWVRASSRQYPFATLKSLGLWIWATLTRTHGMFIVSGSYSNIRCG
ncbi:hypothetical protein TRAPUB_10619 [Trametes pubescens]|uniref:Protein kinase domain-containing protein n=1 Tax=Trametes pubescens TaxID=154538 RepID=A0A1M2VYU2_TRAPU|nr:hypothetical protein TRAPUB_10619 [Trametes pubescens]